MTAQSTHFQAKPLKRSAGKNVIASAAYRAGQKLTDELTGQIFDYTRKQKVEATKIMAPDSAPEWITDRNRLWNEVEQGEKRKDAQLARELEISLPDALSDEGRAKLVFDFAKEHFVGAGMVADICIHGPGAGDDRNHHAHVLLTMRSVSADGFGPKKREWNENSVLDSWKTAWEAACNAALENEGSKVRVDRRSIKQRRQDALDAAKKATDRIEKQRYMIEATRLDYIPRPNLPQTPYRMMVEGKPIPDRWAEKVQAWKDATQSRREAAERAKAMQEVLDREIEAQNVPLGHHEAYEALRGPLSGFDALNKDKDSAALALFLHDPVFDVSSDFAEHVPGLVDATDLRQVRAALSDATIRHTILDVMELDDQLAKPFGDLKDTMISLPEIPRHQPWANAERILTSIAGERVAKTIIAAVERLANLIRSEKIVELNKPAIPQTTSNIGSEKPAQKPEQQVQPKPSSGYSM